MVKIYVTGFHAFGVVVRNPTTALAESLDDLQPDHGEYTLLGSQVLDVAAIPARQFLRRKLYPKVDSALNDEPTDPVIIVHLGVDEKCDHFKLETAAYNEATFRMPDGDGWWPRGAEVDGGDEYGVARRCRLPVAALAKAMGSRGVEVSTDPGRFVCNWTYYLSLQEASTRPGVYPLFVHVPLFDDVPKEAQLGFLKALFGELARCAAEGWEEEPEVETAPSGVAAGEE